MMTTREAFKAGFLLACADLGLSGDQARETIVKTASILSLLTSPVQAAAGLAPLASVALPVAAGLGAGYLASRATAPLEDAEDMQTHELIRELKTLASRAKERQESRKILAA